MAATLKELLAQLKSAEIVPRPDNEEWAPLINRISTPGIIAAIEEETYFQFLECLPPKFQRGSLFAFAEGAEPLRLFWAKRNPLGPEGQAHYFCRQLIWDETQEFCRLAGLSFPYWY